MARSTSKLLILFALNCTHLNAQDAVKPDESWKVHTIYEGEACMTAVAADFTKDGIMDVMADTGSGHTRLFVGPDWKEISIESKHDGRYIHSETWDIDGDGDADYVGAHYNPGLIVWYEQPDKPLTQNGRGV